MVKPARLLLIMLLLPAGFSAGPLSAQIENLEYCGLRKQAGHFVCYSSIHHCFLYNIRGTCRARKVHDDVRESYTCLYSHGSRLWGCYTKRETCLHRSGGHPDYVCVDLR